MSLLQKVQMHNFHSISTNNQKQFFVKIMEPQFNKNKFYSNMHFYSL